MTQAFEPLPNYRFKSAGFDCCAIVMDRQQTWQENQAFLISRRWSVIVGIANAISKPGVFGQSSICRPVVSNCGSFNQKWRAISFSFGEHCPDYARHLVGQRNRRHLNALAGGKLNQPHVEAVRLFHPLLQDGMSPLCEELAQISVPAPLDVSQRLRAASGVFSGHHANQAANPRPFLNADPLPIAAVAVIGPFGNSRISSSG